MSTFSRNIIIQSRIVLLPNVTNTSNLTLYTVPSDSFAELAFSPPIYTPSAADEFNIQVDDGSNDYKIFVWVYDGTNWKTNFSAVQGPYPPTTPLMKFGPGTIIKSTNVKIAGGTVSLGINGVEFKNAIQ